MDDVTFCYNGTGKLNRSDKVRNHTSIGLNTRQQRPKVYYNPFWNFYCQGEEKYGRVSKQRDKTNKVYIYFIQIKEIWVSLKANCNIPWGKVEYEGKGKVIYTSLSNKLQVMGPKASRGDLP
jgi:hypothetical protein